MGAEQPKTIAEIVAKLRLSGNEDFEYVLDYSAPEVVALELKLADDIEAAWKNELTVEMRKHLDVTGELVVRLDQVMHRLAYLSGRLDVVGGKEEELVKLMRECSKELRQMSHEHFASAGKPVAIVPCAVQEVKQTRERKKDDPL